MSFPERLESLVRQRGSALVLGLDPRPECMPREYRDRGSDGITAFHAKLIELCSPYIVGIKPQIAFFELLGEEGLSIYAESCRLGREAGIVVIGDVKRGDIGSTAEAYAEAHYRWADALTVNAYLGSDAVEPFLGPCRGDGKGLFVVTVTSNPGWQQFQSYRGPEGKPLYLAVAEAVSEWNSSCRGTPAPRALGRRDRTEYGPVGAVVGATHPEVLVSLRERLAESWLLLPGVGAQGAKAADVAPAFDDDGLGALLPVSRGLAACFSPDDAAWEGKVVDRARELVAEIRDAVVALRPS